VCRGWGNRTAVGLLVEVVEAVARVVGRVVGVLVELALAVGVVDTNFRSQGNK